MAKPDPSVAAATGAAFGQRICSRHRPSVIEQIRQATESGAGAVPAVYINGGRVREVPFHYQARNAGKSHARLIKFGWAFTKTLARMWRLRYSK